MTKRFILSGLNILNTRPSPQNQVLSEALKAAGAIAIDLPALVIEELHWELPLSLIEQTKQVIFISSNAVRYFFNGLNKKNIRWPKHITISVVGHETALALKQYDLEADFIPQEKNSEGILQLANFSKIKNELILLVKGEGGRKELQQGLQERGCDLRVLDVYKRGLPHMSNEAFELWDANKIDIIVATSEETIKNLFNLFPAQAGPWLCQKPWVVISERLAKTARQLGIETIIQSRYDTILDSLHAFNQGFRNDRDN